jgi:hypothetical protein
VQRWDCERLPDGEFPWTVTTLQRLIANAAAHEPPINVGFQGKSGHDADMAKSTRLTQIIADPTMFDCYANRRRS